MPPDNCSSTTTTAVAASVCVICKESNSKLHCMSKILHSFCEECFNNYASTSFEAVGRYCTKIRNSEQGELPCPFFGRDGCTCHSFPDSTLRRHLTDEVFELWKRAIGRNAVEKSDLERAAVTQAQANSYISMSLVDYLKHSVTEAQSLGACMLCPDCGVRGIKDDACMHMECDHCGNDWCYCCGCLQGSCWCDKYGITLEDHKRYKNRELDGETSGYGALHEFHRDKIAFFLRRIKDSVKRDLWKELQNAYPDLLKNVPTEGRSIEWHEIDQAKVPLFGETEENQVEWRNDIDAEIASLQERLDAARLVEALKKREKEDAACQELVEQLKSELTSLQERFEAKNKSSTTDSTADIPESAPKQQAQLVSETSLDEEKSNPMPERRVQTLRQRFIKGTLGRIKLQ